MSGRFYAGSKWEQVPQREAKNLVTLAAWLVGWHVIATDATAVLMSPIGLTMSSCV
ncbi:hypothetical protein BDN67DRAFT_966455 [Paxillus ammoniavirescens]|nr:hypothetical protein BDN67DRAFT_966455 [Paxillus ammoniavirescens]